MEEPFKVGVRFASFATLEEMVQQFGHKTQTTFWKRDARTIAKTQISRTINPSLIYYQLVYACSKGGRKFKKSGTNVRQSYTYKRDCPVHIRFIASADGQALEVTSFDGNHNHETSQVCFAY